MSKAGCRRGHLQSVLVGVDKLRAVVEPYRPETVAKVCGVPAETIVELTRQLASTRNAVLYGRMGTSVQAFGGVSTWLIYCLNLLTGHMDRRGHDVYHLCQPSICGSRCVRRTARTLRPLSQPLARASEFGVKLPAAALAEEILEPGRGKFADW